MKKKRDFELRKIGDENVLIALGAKNVDFSRIISFNESAAKLWNELTYDEFNEEDLATMLTYWYEIDMESALMDAKTLMQAWFEAGITE